MRKLIAAALVCGVVVFSFLQFYSYLKERIATSDLKRVTEKRISAFLKVPVRVDRISVGLLKHISVSGLEINRTQKGYPLLIAVKKIIVRYDLMSFLKRNFRIPTEIFLDAPRLTFQAFQSPGSLLELSFLRSDRGILTRFEFEEGEVQLPWFRPEEKLYLTGVEGKALPKRGNLFDVRFKSRLSGAASGSVLAYGEFEPDTKQYRLEVSLDDISFSKVSQIEVTQVKGTIEFENDLVKIRKLEFLLRGIPCELSGEIRNFLSSKPTFALSVNFRDGKLTVHSDLQADFGREIISGLIRFADREFRFSGSLKGGPMNFQIPRLILNDSYLASGIFDVPNGAFQIKAEHQNERIQFDSSVKGFAAQVLVKLDHFKLFDFDLVTSALIDLKPYEKAWEKGSRVFDVQVKTDYLIFQYQPLRDFAAGGKLSQHGIDELLAHWGSVSELRGKVLFGKVPEADLTLRAGPLALKGVESLGVHPLATSMDGIFEGKLEVKGPLENPYLDGFFTIEKGIAGTLKYDRAVLNFSGRLPYLVLKNSKVWKANNSFLLTGGLNFELKNFLEGIQLGNSEHVVLWRGVELSGELRDLSSRQNAISSLAQSQVQGVGQASARLGKMEAEYKLGDGASLQVTAEEDQAKRQYLTGGPKVKF